MWEIDFSFPGGKKRRRMRFYRKVAGEAYRLALAKNREYKAHGQLAHALTSGQRWEAAECYKLLQPVTKTTPVTLVDIVRDFLKLHPEGGRARTLDQLRVELIESKKKGGRSDRHVASLDYRLRALAAALGDKPITAITTADLDEELRRHPNWNATTVHSVVQGWKVALNFAIRREYLVRNPADKLELPRIVHEEPEVLSVLQVRKLMAATLFADRDPLLPQCRAYLAIGIFAGIRPLGELPFLDWQDINLDAGTITIRAATAKARVRRIVTMEPNLIAWLRPIAKERGSVLTRPVDELRLAARRVLNVTRWPADVMRHTFASYYFELHQNEQRTKKQLGHRDDGRVFYDHYCRPVEPSEATRFWNIFPPCDVLPCADNGWRETHPETRLAVSLAA